MTIHQIRGVLIHTSHDYPPIPDRSMDWSAVEDNYDCDCDQDGYFSNSPVGHGATEREAIDDLLEQIEEHEGGIGLLYCAKLLGEFVLMAFAVCVFLFCAALVADFDPPDRAPLCQAGSVNALLTNCEVDQ